MEKRPVRLPQLRAWAFVALSLGLLVYLLQLHLPAPSSPPLIGSWQATQRSATGELRLLLEIFSLGASTYATLSIPQWGLVETPLREVALFARSPHEPTLEFTLPLDGREIRFALNVVGQSLIGVTRQGNELQSIQFHRTTQAD